MWLLVLAGRRPTRRIPCFRRVAVPPFHLRRGGGGAAAPAKTLPSEYASELGNADTVVRPYIMGQDARLGDKPKKLMDMMPSWVGYSALYGISIIPAMFVVGCVVILFINSLN
uniref:Uncharacterized protein n=1 Tax=Chlamydomonas euryale TaxID=1486919 RepID=A0A7R9VB06_9CHLO|mmetsp:Transcript_3022/g.8228  ORF Transcript_3022/g.8228 Transcript_3022/m.8228 type:complete len:113 (+) Transcript_3022:262-600(+)